MSELKPCPFCDDLDPYVSGDNWNGWYVVCSGCGADGSTESTKAEAIDAWNTRAERTCRIAEYDDAPFFVCSECGAVQPDGFTVYYCWNCGAKAVGE